MTLTALEPPRPDDWTDLLPELHQQASDIVVPKRTRPGETGTTQAIIDLLATRAASR